MVVFTFGIFAQAFAYNFSAVSPSGHTLYYNISSSGNHVSVTYPSNDPYNPYNGYTEPTGTLIIPDSVYFNGNYYIVTSIGDWAFSFCSNIVSVSIPRTTKIIGDCAFGSCTSLSSIILPDSIISLGVCAFQNCAFDTIIIPHSVSSIGNFAFKNCTHLVSLTIPTSVVNIGFMSFDSCINLTSITIDTNTLSLHSNDTSMGRAYIDITNSSSWDYSLKIIATPKQGYKFHSWSTGNTSNPDIIYLTEDSIISAFFTYMIEPRICMVDVENERNILYIDLDENALQYNIYRESVVSNVYDLLASVNADSISAWIDSSSRPNTRSYRYRISAIDPLGFESELSNVHKTMHLSINQGIGGHWNLSWTPYEGTNYSTYIIYRGTSTTELEQIDAIPANGNTSYTDEDAPSGTIYYQVGIVMNNTCQSSFPFSSKNENICRSNIATNSAVGINDNKLNRTRIYTSNGMIIVDDPLHEQVRIFDIIGRQIKNCSLPTGVYFVKVGNHVSRKIAVINE